MAKSKSKKAKSVGVADFAFFPEDFVKKRAEKIKEGQVFGETDQRTGRATIGVIQRAIGVIAADSDAYEKSSGILP
jgi:hypothetical protein